MMLLLLQMLKASIVFKVTKQGWIKEGDTDGITTFSKD